MDWTDTMAPGERVVAQLLDYLPSLLSAGLVFFGGLFLALVLRSLVRWVVVRTGIDALAERVGVSRLLYSIGLQQGLPAVLGNLVGLVCVLIVFATSAEILGLPGVAEGVGAVVEFVPNLVAAAILTLFGFVSAEFLSRLVDRLGRSRDDVMSARFGAVITYYGVLLVVLTTAVHHLGVQTDLVNMLITVAAAGASLAAALALAFAGREPLRDVLSRFYAERLFPIGTTVEIDGISGVVARYDTLTVELDCEDRRVTLPCRMLVSAPVRHG